MNAAGLGEARSAANASAVGHLPLDVVTHGEGPPLVLLHGFGASRFTFRLWVDELAQTHSVHLVDLFGHGTAPPPQDQRYGPLEQADAVTHWIRAADLRQTVLIGHSLGGGVALLVALNLIQRSEIDRVAALVSVAGPAYSQAMPTYISLARIPALGRTLLRLVGVERVVRNVLEHVVFDRSTITGAQIAGYADPLRRPTGRSALIQTARQIVPPGLDELATHFPSLDLPVLLLWGRHDPVIPLWVGERMERELPRARLVVLERCGHLPPEEVPAESLSAVRTVLDTTDTRTRQRTLSP